MVEIVATNVVASRSPERRPTATPTARANSGPLTSLPVVHLTATDYNADRSCQYFRIGKNLSDKELKD